MEEDLSNQGTITRLIRGAYFCGVSRKLLQLKANYKTHVIFNNVSEVTKLHSDCLMMLVMQISFRIRKLEKLIKKRL